METVFTNESYWVNLYTDATGLDRLDKGYEVVELGKSVRRESGLIRRRFEKLTGTPVGFFVKDASIYELVGFFKSAASTKCQLGLIKRNITDFKQEGAVTWLGEYSINIELRNLNVGVYPDATGITILSGHQLKGDIQPFVARYDYNLVQVWKKEPQLLATPDIHISGYTGDERGGLLALRTSTSPVLINGRGQDKSPVSFMVLEADGKTTPVNPNFGEPEMTFTDGDFYVDIERGVLTGIGLTGKVTDGRLQPDAFGYAYFQCGIDGTVTAFEHRRFTYGDIYSEEAKAYAKSVSGRTITDEEPFPNVDRPRFSAIRKGDGSFIVRIGNLYTDMNEQSDKNPPLAGSNVFFEVDASGALVWKHFHIEPPRKIEMVTENRTNPGIYDDYFILKNNQLYWFDYVPESRFAGERYTLPQEPESLKDVDLVPAIVTIDCASGKMTGCKQLQPKADDGLMFDAFFAREIPGSALERPVFLLYTNDKRSEAQFVKVTLD